MISLKAPILPLRIILAIVGIVIVILGFDVAFGGIRTLGWLGPTDFIEVVNSSDFRVQDSHFRFLGGVWIGIGFVFVAGAFALRQLRLVLIVLCGLVFIGGLARFTGPSLATLFNLSVLPSLITELFVFPLLGYWIARSGKDHHSLAPHVDSLSPTMPIMIRPMQPRRMAVAGSLNRSMPTITVPIVPMPVQIA